MSAFDLVRRFVSGAGVLSGAMMCRAALAALFFLMLPVMPDAYANSTQETKAVRPPRRRVVTNKELEPLRLRREAQEQEYERTRRERGMPSKEELRERVEEHDRRLRETARQLEEELREAELEALRAELAIVRQQLGNLSLQLSQQPAAYWPAYAPPPFYPYFYGPPVQIINDLSFGARHRFGHKGFGLFPHAGLRPHGRLRGHFTPIYVAPSRNAPPPRLSPRMPRR